jgi:hypothetical protein
MRNVYIDKVTPGVRLNAPNRVTKLTGLYCNLDGGFDSNPTRKVFFNAGMIPHTLEHPRHRKTTQRGGNGCAIERFIRGGSE